jgi:DNA replication protein DnaC
MNMSNSSNDLNRFTAVWSSFNIPLRLAQASFDAYQPTSPEQEKALAKCRAYADAGLENINKGRGLFLQGPVGTGKSHLAVAILRSILENNLQEFGKPINGDALAGEPIYEGKHCLMVSVVDLLGILRESFSADSLKAPARRLLHRARADALVILDDIGAEKPSDWVEEQLYALIDLRYRMQRSTIFTTNCTLKQLENQIGSRVVSRIFEMCEGVKLEGRDWRKRRI